MPSVMHGKHTTFYFFSLVRCLCSNDATLLVSLPACLSVCLSVSVRICLCLPVCLFFRLLEISYHYLSKTFKWGNFLPKAILSSPSLFFISSFLPSYSFSFSLNYVALHCLVNNIPSFFFLLLLLLSTTLHCTQFAGSRIYQGRQNSGWCEVSWTRAASVKPLLLG